MGGVTYDLMVKNHTQSKNAAEQPVFKVLLQSDDPKIKFRIESGSSAIFEEYPLGQPISVQLNTWSQQKLEQHIKK